jgi:hypothetical protein
MRILSFYELIFEVRTPPGTQVFFSPNLLQPEFEVKPADVNSNVAQRAFARKLGF